MTTSASRAPSIPVVLVRLKLRLLRNRSRQRGGRFGLLLGTIAAVIGAVLGFTAAVSAGRNADPRLSRAFVVLGANAIALGWALLPLLFFGTDETLDPSRLQLLPLERRPLMTGLLVSSLLGYAPFAVLATLAGVVVGYGSGAAAPIVLVAVVLLALLCAAAARALATALAALLTSRRGRDVSIIVFTLFAVGIQLLRFVRLGHIDPAFWDRASNISQWLPPGMVGQAVFDAQAQHWARAIVELVPALVILPLLLAAWGRALERSLTIVASDSGSGKPARDPSRATPLLPRGIPFLRATAWGAVAAKELRYIVRDPRRKVLTLQRFVLGVGGPIWFALRAGTLAPGTVVVASLAGYLALAGAMNQFGFDGGALWLDIVAGNRIRDELVGKNFAVLVQILPVVFLGSVALAVVSGGWLYIPAALVIAAAGLGAGLAVANVVSVHYPARLPESKSPFGGGGGGQGCVTGLMYLLGVLVQGVLLAPVGIATGICLAVAPVGLLVVAPASAAYGFALWRAGTSMAERWAWWRQPELLLAVDQRRGV